ncbi:hypothetical protein HY477_03850 [Candidatus Uhrbacteria bacterium]|nr:hypothetical protein [Candidatus Uhrbacteria bacterium]
MPVIKAVKRERELRLRMAVHNRSVKARPARGISRKIKPRVAVKMRRG